MEMKYLVEQDSGKIYLPVVHANGIIGLDINNDEEAKLTNIVYASNDISIDLDIAELNKMIFASLEIDFINNNTQDETPYWILLNGGTVDISIDDNAISTFIPMIFNCIAYDDIGEISGDIEVYVKLIKGRISIQAALKKNTYSVNDIGVISKKEEPLSISKIVGSANGLIIGGA